MKPKKSRFGLSCIKFTKYMYSSNKFDYVKPSVGISGWKFFVVLSVICVISAIFIGKKLNKIKLNT